MGVKVSGISLEVDEGQDKLIGHQAVYRGDYFNLPQSTIANRVRFEVLRKLFQQYPEFFEKEEVIRSRPNQKLVQSIIFGAGILYAGSIILGRRLIKKHNRIPPVKMAFIYLAPLVISLTCLYALVSVKTGLAISEISKERRESLPNDKLFAYGLALYQERFANI